MSIVFSIVFIIYVIISAVLGYRKMAEMKKTVINERERIKFYKECVLEGCLLTVLQLVVLFSTKIPIQKIGITAINISYLDYPIWIKIVTFVLCGLFLALLLYQIAGYLLSENYRVETKKSMANMIEKGKSYDAMLDIMIPKSRREKRWFTAVSATAGIGEEIMFRGFLSYLLVDLYPKAPIYILLLLLGVIFSIVHCYQGFKGIIKTGLTGILFATLYFASGSLLPGILLHFISDFSSNFLLSEEQGQQEALS